MYTPPQHKYTHTQKCTLPDPHHHT